MTYLAPVVHLLLFVFKFLQQIRLKVHIKSMIFPMDKRKEHFQKNNNNKSDIESYFTVS